jgi:hypothetical protein
VQTNSDATKKINNFAENVVFINSTYKKAGDGLEPLSHCATLYSQCFLRGRARRPPLFGRLACGLATTSRLAKRKIFHQGNVGRND